MQIIHTHTEIPYWKTSVSEQHFDFTIVEGQRFAVTNRSYYYDSKDRKIRYETMKPSVGFIAANLYIEIKPGYFRFIRTVSETTLASSMERYKDLVSAIPSDQIDKWANAIDL